MSLRVTRVSPTPDLLGECPLWDPWHQRLYWVDGVSCKIKSYDPATGTFDEWNMSSMIGSIGLAGADTLVAGLADGICLVDLRAGDCAPLFRPEPADPRLRFNDGKVDRAGRFVCGSMGVHAEPLGQLVRVDVEGAVAVLETGIRISNTLCFSPDGRIMYFADSLDNAIRAYEYGSEADAVGPPRRFVDTRIYGSGPDGATVDGDGCLWVALVQAGKIARFTPDGTLDRLIDAPIDIPSCVAFGGPDLSVLFVTSIKDSGSGRAISRHPDGGHLFAIEGLGVSGLPEPRFGVPMASSGC